MPSPKAGTVTPKLADTIKEIKKGRVEFKLDK
jgi:large subunit ribosomal protein L1